MNCKMGVFLCGGRDVFLNYWKKLIHDTKGICQRCIKLWS